jgi:FkbM family methyltransferase
MGKRKRNAYLVKSGIQDSRCFLEGHICLHPDGFKVLPRQKTDDYDLLFLPRELVLDPYLKPTNQEDDGYFVDVGANVGFYSLRAAAHGQRVIAIEAHPQTYTALEKNLSFNNFRYPVISINKAVSERADVIELYEHYDFKGAIFAGHSSIIQRFEQMDNNNIAKVTADALDNILSPYHGSISVLKMDIEGAEIMALKGATETLKRTGRIVIEVHKLEYIELIKEILINNGFSSHVLKDNVDKQIYVIGLR